MDQPVPGAAQGRPDNFVNELVRSGEIEHVRVGKRILISRGTLEKFIEVNMRVAYYPQ